MMPLLSAHRTVSHLVAGPALLAILSGSPAIVAAREHDISLPSAPEPSVWLLVVGILLLVSRRSRRARS